MAAETMRCDYPRCSKCGEIWHSDVADCAERAPTSAPSRSTEGPEPTRESEVRSEMVCTRCGHTQWLWRRIPAAQEQAAGAPDGEGAEPELHRCDRCLQDLTASTQVAALRRRLFEVEAERDQWKEEASTIDMHVDEQVNLANELHEARSQLQEAKQRVSEVEAGYRCYYCNEVFTGNAARDHFNQNNSNGARSVAQCLRDAADAQVRAAVSARHAAESALATARARIEELDKRGWEMEAELRSAERRISEVEAERDRAREGADAMAAKAVTMIENALRPVIAERDAAKRERDEWEEQVLLHVSAEAHFAHLAATAESALATAKARISEVEAERDKAREMFEAAEHERAKMQAKIVPLVECYDAAAHQREQLATAHRQLAEARQAVERLRERARPLVECAALLEALNAAVVWELAPEITAAIREILPRARAVLPRFAPTAHRAQGAMDAAVVRSEKMP